MKLKILLYIIYSFFSVSVLQAQMAGNDEYGQDPGDNWVEFNIHNVRFTTEGVDRFFECEVRAKSLGVWYNFTNGEKPTNPKHFIDVIRNATLNFSYNSDVLESIGGQPIIEWGDNWKDEYSELRCELLEAADDKFLYFGWEGCNRYTPGVPTDEYVLVSKFKWKLKPGASGKTGFEMRKIGVDRGSSAVHDLGGNLGISLTGNGDTLIPNTNVPAKPVLAQGLDTLICATSLPSTSVYSIIDLPEFAEKCVWTISPADAGVITAVNDTAVSVEWKTFGTHTLSVYAENKVGKSDVVSKTIKVNQHPTATLARQIFGCNDAMLTCSDVASTTTAIQWLDKDKTALAGGNENNFTVLQSGDYWLALDNAGCKDTSRMTTVQMTSQPQVDVARVQTACGDQLTLLAKAVDDIGEVCWLKADKQTQLTDFVVHETTALPYYWAYVKAGSCMSDTVQVKTEFGKKPTANVPPTLTQCAVIGEGSYIRLRYSELSSATVVAKWYSNDACTQEVSNGMADNGSGEYHLVLTDNGGCTDTLHTFVGYFRKPEATVLPVITACPGGKAILSYTGLSAGTAKWLDANKTQLAEQNDPAVTNAGQYYLALKDAACVDTLSVRVEFNDKVPNVSVPPLFTACGTTAVLKYEGGSGAALAWMKSDKTTVLSEQNPYSHQAYGPAEDYFYLRYKSTCLDSLIPVTVKYNTQPEVNGLRDVVTACGETAVLSYESISGGRGAWSKSGTFSSGSILSESKSYIVTKQSGDKDTVTYYLHLYGSGCGEQTFPVQVMFNTPPRVNVEPVQTTCDAVNGLLSYSGLTAGSAVWTNTAGAVLSALNPYPVTNGADNNYKLVVKDGTCEVEYLVEMKFGARPLLDVSPVQTACGESHELFVNNSTGTVRWYKNLVQAGSELTSLLVDKNTHGSVFQVFADGGGCQSDTLTVQVNYNTVRPSLNVDSLQMACGSEHTLYIRNSTAPVRWFNASSKQEIHAPYKVTSTVPATMKYYAVAVGGADCTMNDTAYVTVKFGTVAKPVIDVDRLQASCGLTHNLYVNNASAAVKWFKDAALAQEIISPYQVSASDGTEFYACADGGGCYSDTVRVAVAYRTTPSLNVSDQIACGSTHTLFVTSSTAPVRWFSVKNDPSSEIRSPYQVTGIGTETYYAVATTGSCQSDTVGVKVTFNSTDKPVLKVTSPQTSCGNVHTLFVDAAGAEVRWYSDASLANEILAPYQVTASVGNEFYAVAGDKDKCAAYITTAKVEVIYNARPALKVDDQIACGQTHTLFVTENSAPVRWFKDQAARYELASTKVNAPNPNSDKQIEYYYAFADGGSCQSDTLEVKVTFNTAEKPSLDVFTPQTACSDEHTLFVNNSNVKDIHWLTAKTGTELTDLTVKAPVDNSGKATYYVYAKSSESCAVSSDTVAVDVIFDMKPGLDVNTEQITCGDKLQLAVSDGTTAKVRWFYGNSKQNELLTPYVVSNGSPATNNTYYAVAVGDVCHSDTAYVKVTFNNTAKPAIDADPVQTACGNSYTLRVNSHSAPYHWFKAGSTTEIPAPYIVNKEAGSTETEYFVYAQADGCISSDTVHVTVKFDVAKPGINVPAEQLACGTEHYLLGSSTAQLHWYKKTDNTKIFEPFKVKLTDGADYYAVAVGDGCHSDTAYVKVTFNHTAKPVIDVDRLQASCGTTHTLYVNNASAAVKWFGDRNLTKEILTPYQVSSTVDGAEFYAFADGGGCYSDTVRVAVSYKAQPSLNVSDQVACGNEHTLFVTSSTAPVRWFSVKNDPSSEILAPYTVTSSDSGVATTTYYAFADAGSCQSDTVDVKVTFNSTDKPALKVTSPQTSCGNVHTLFVDAAGAEVHWYSDASLANEILPPYQVSGQTKFYAVAGDKDKCAANITKAEVEVIYNARPALKVDDQIACGRTHTLFVTENTAPVRWFSVKNDPSSEILAPYQVTNSASGVATTTYYAFADGGSCQSDTVAVKVTFNSLEKPSLDVFTPQTACGDEHTLFVNNSNVKDIHWLTAKTGGTELADLTVQTPADHSGKATYYVYAKSSSESCAVSSDTVAVDVIFDMKPGLDVNTEQITCGDKLQLAVSDGTTAKVRWFYGNSKQNELLTPYVVSNGSPATNNTYYAVAVGDVCHSDTIQVKVKFGATQKPMIDVDPVQTACGNSYTLRVNSHSAPYHWFKAGSTTEIPTPYIVSTAGEYFVYAQADGCVSSDTVHVTVKFDITKPGIEVPAEQLACGTEHYLLGSSTASLQWYEKDSGKEIFAPYKVENTVTDYYAVAVGDGCHSDTAYVKVTFNNTAKPVIDVDPVQTACGNSYTLRVNDHSAPFHWFKNGSATEIPAPYIVNKETGSTETEYFVYAKSAASCGVSSDTVHVTVKFDVDKPGINVPAEQLACGTEHYLLGSSTAQLHWYNKTGGSEIFEPFKVKSTDGADYYAVAVGDGCYSDTAYVKVTFNNADKPTIDVNPVQTACGNTLTLRVNDFSAPFHWYKKDSNVEIRAPYIVSEAGDYLVYAKSAASCGVSSDTAYVTVNLKVGKPGLDVDTVQMSCGDTHRLFVNQGTTAPVRWLDKNGTEHLAPVTVKKIDSDKTYKVFADAGDCQSDTLAVRVVFDITPAIDVEKIQTSCSNTHLLTVNSSNTQKVRWFKDINDAATELAAPFKVTASAGSGNTADYYVFADGGGCYSDTVKVTVNFNADKPSLNVPAIQTSCGSEHNLQVTDHTAPIHWFTAAKEELASPYKVTAVMGGNYYVYAGQGTCVSDTVDVTVKFSTKPYAVGLPELITSCGNTSAQLFFSDLTDPKATYEWLNSDKTLAGRTNPLTVNKEGLYYLKVSGSCGHTLIATEVMFNTKPLAEGLPETVTSCTGEAQLSFDKLSVSGATFAWYKDGAKESEDNPYTVNVPGDYSLKISAGSGCESDVKVKVQLNTQPVPLGLKDIVSSCGASEAYLAFTLSDPKATFEWFKGGISLGSANPLKVAEAGDYTLNIRSTGCSLVTKTVKVNMNGTRPLANAGKDQTVVSNGIVQLFGTASAGVAPYKYSWKPKGSVEQDKDTIQAPKTVALTENTEFYLQVEDAAGCISVPDTMKVSINASAFKVVATAAPAAICMSNTSRLGVTLPVDKNAADMTFAWVGEGLSGANTQNPVFTPAKAGKYTFAVTVSDGPNTTLAMTEVTVGAGEAPVLALDAPTSCSGDTIWVENINTKITDPLTYQWYADGRVVGGNQDYHVLSTAARVVKVVAMTAGNACASDTLAFNETVGTAPELKWAVEPLASVTSGLRITGATTFETGKEGTAPYSYTWLSPIELAGNSDSSFMIGSASGFGYNFEVMVVDNKGCRDTLDAKTTVTSAGNLALTVEGANAVCKDGVAILTATIGKAAVAPYTFEWLKDGVSVPVRKVTTYGLTDKLVLTYAELLRGADYIVRVSDSKADGMSTDQQQIPLTVDQNKTAPKVKVDPKEQTILSGASTVLLATATLDGNWLWSPADKLNSEAEATLQYPQTAALTAGQKYQVYAESAGCISTPDTAQVKISDDGYRVQVTPDTTICLGNKVVLEAIVSGKDKIGLTYQWKVGSTVLSNAATALYTATVAGNQVAIVTVSKGGKILTAGRVNITVNGGRAPEFTLASVGNGCQGDTVKVVYAAGAPVKATAYDWKVNGSLITEKSDRYVLTGDPATYQLEVTGHAENGCASDQAALTVTTKLTPQILKLAQIDSCGQGVVEVTAKNAKKYSWTSMSGNPGVQNSLDDTQYIVSDLGAFEVKVTAKNDNCQVSAIYKGEVFERPRGMDCTITPETANKGDQIIATAKAFGGTDPYTYHWLQPAEVTGETFTIESAKYASYVFEAYAVDMNGCLSDTIVKERSVIGGELEVTLESAYGDACRNGAALLTAQAKGYGQYCKYVLKADGITILTRNRATNRDTFWVYPTANTTYEITAMKIGDESTKASKELEVSVSTKQAPQISAGPDMTVRKNGSTTLLGTVTPPAKMYKWVWSPANKLATAADTALQYPQTAKLQANQKYSVFAVGENGCLSKPDEMIVKVDNTNGFSVEINPQDQEICQNGTLSLQAEITAGTVGGGATYTWSPVDHLDPVNAAEVDFKAPAMSGDYTYAVLVSNGSVNAAARTTVKVSDQVGFNLGWKDGRMACVGDTLKVIAAEKNLNYIWKLNGLEVVNGSDSIFILGMTGNNKIEVAASRTGGNGCASNVLMKEMSVGALPAGIDILREPFAAPKDSIFSLVAVGNGDLENAGYDFAWTTKPAGQINGATNGLNAVSQLLNGDVRYIFTAKSTEACQASDSVNVYLIPEAPAATIKANDANTNIVLSWTAVAGAQEYVIKRTLNDPYNVLGNGYQSVATVTGTFWAENSVNDMAFYQVVAQRKVVELPEASVISTVKDTLGLTRHAIKVNENSNLTSYTRVAILFDVEQYCGLKTTADLGDLLTSAKVLTFSMWSFTGQEWKTSTYRNSWRNPMDLKPYSVVRIEARQPFELLLFGKLLPQPVSEYLLNGREDLTNYADAYLQLNKPDISVLKDIGESITNENCYTIRKWDFVDQEWKRATYSRQKWSGTYGIKVGGSFQIELKKVTKW